MSTPLEDFRAYLEQYDTTGYSFALGRWTETTNTANNRYIVLRQYGARRPILSMRFVGVQVLIVGKRDEQSGISAVSQFANGLHDFVQQRKTGGRGTYWSPSAKPKFLSSAFDDNRQDIDNTVYKVMKL